MLKQLSIRDYAIIHELDLAFQPGMTVLTGETGAGKSILVGALGLVLGDRGDSGVIRPGGRGAEISALFDIGKVNGARDLLREQSIPEDQDGLLVRRLVSSDGRSRAFVNSIPVTVQVLRSLGNFLVDIHGQHAHQSLVRQEVQRALLDDYGDYGAVLAAVRGSCREWQECTDRLAAMAANNDAAAVSLLHYQVQELELLNPEDGEYEQLDGEHRRLANARQLLESVQRSIITLQDDDASVESGISRVLSELRDLHKVDTSLGGISLLLNEASIQISEAGSELRAYLERLASDPERLQQVEQRLSALHDMARKHRVAAPQLAQHLADLQQRLSCLRDSQENATALRDRQSATLQEYRRATAELHACRCRCAGALSAEITTRIRKLGMPSGEFEIQVAHEEQESPRLHGWDQIDYRVNINPGQELRSLRKVASGGELSRISLAIQVTGSRDRGVPCLVFDEVDAGIGGATAEIVGRLLHELARRRQVLCVTHLPQVASRGDHHLQVNKVTNKTSTRTEIRDLDADARINEIARMLGGLKVTEQTRKHAREMLAG